MTDKQIPKFHITDYIDSDFYFNTRSGANIFHIHDYFEILYMLKGRAEHYINSKNQEFKPGVFMLMRPGDLHLVDDSSSGRSERRNILVAPELFQEICNFCCEGLYEKICNNEDPLKVTLPGDLQLIIEERLHRCEMIDSVDIRRHGIKSVVSMLLHLYNESLCLKAEYPEWISQILMLMQSQEVLMRGMPYLVEKSGFSHGYLCREIKRYTGKTPIHVLTDYRMVSARALLKNTSLSVLDISKKLGYGSVSHFITKFKEYYNISPLQYRNV